MGRGGWGQRGTRDAESACARAQATQTSGRLGDGDVDKTRVVEAEGGRRLVAERRARDGAVAGATRAARQAAVRLHCDLGRGVGIEDRVAAVAVGARALEHARVIRLLLGAPVPRLLRLDPWLKLDAAMHVVARDAAVATARVDLHRRDVPRFGRLDELREPIGVAVERLATLAAVALGEHLRRRNIRIVAKCGRWVVDRDPLGGGAVRGDIIHVGGNALEVRVSPGHPRHVMMVVSPVDGHGDIPIRVDARLAHGVD